MTLARNRFKCDNEWNQRLIHRVGPRATFDLVESRELRVGHVIKVNCDSEFPADLVLLQVCDTFACVLYRVTCDVRNV